MKRNLLALTSLAMMLAMVSGSAYASTVLVLDTAAKSSAYLPQQVVEAKALLAQLKDGERVAVVLTAPTSKTIFDNILGSETRVGLGSTLATIYAFKGNSDLGAALAVATSLASRGQGPKRIVLFTPGVPQPPKRSVFYGLLLEQLLGDARVVPDDTIVIVRLYGGSTLSTSRGNVRVIRATPQWENELGFTQPVPPQEVEAPASALPTRPAVRRFGVWVASGVLTFGVFAALGVWAWRQRRVQTTLRRREEEERQMLTAGMTSPSEDNDTEEKLIFNLDVGEGELTLGEGDTLIAGDRWDADPFFTAAGACARFVVRAGALSVENIGTGSLTIGSLPLSPGATRRLPVKYLEVFVGSHLITVMPEIAPVDSAESQLLDVREGVI
jgi:hypothetical protein